jgi:hypothetical protein
MHLPSAMSGDAAEVQALDAFFAGRDDRDLLGRPLWWNLQTEEE